MNSKSKITIILVSIFSAICVTLGILLGLSLNGYVRLFKESINIITGSISATYDGEVKEAGFTYTGNLVSGDKIVPNKVFSTIHAGNYVNESTYYIIDSKGKDVTDSYNITYTKGFFEIEQRDLIIKTISGIFVADSKMHYYSSYNIARGSLASADVLSVTGFRGFKYPGTYANSISFRIVNNGSIDVSKDYNVYVDEGTIFVLGVSGDGTITIPGTGEIIIKPGEGGDETGGDDEDSDTDIRPSGDDFENNGIVARTYTKERQTIYLREKSYGAYDLKGFKMGTRYKVPSGETSGLNYVGKKLGNNKEVKIIEVEKTSKNYIPYYTSIDALTNDVDYTSSETTYTYQYNNFDYLTNYPSISKTGVTNTYEALSYRNYVYNNYLTLDNATRFGLEKIIETNSLNTGDNYKTIKKCVNYIKHAAVYDKNFAFPDSCKNVVLDFLNVYKTGCCRHYAAALVTMLITLGIPARYVEGYYVPSQIGYTDVYGGQAHAWTEAYIDGFGWVELDATGGSSAVIENQTPGESDNDAVTTYPGEDGNITGLTGDEGTAPTDNPGDSDNPGEGTDPGDGSGGTIPVPGFDDAESGDVVLVSSTAEAAYNGNALKSEKYKIYGLDLDKYHIEVIFNDNNSIKDVGLKENICLLYIYDKVTNENVTLSFGITYHYGFLHVSAKNITLSSESLNKKYDGIPAKLDKITVSLGALVAGQELVIDTNSFNTFSEKGSYINYFYIDGIYNSEKSVEYTDNYAITYDYGNINIY